MDITKKGFTLLELIIVIAIIAVLAAILLVFLGDARDKGSEASIQSHLVGARAQAELYYHLNAFLYTDVCTSSHSDDPQGVAEFVSQADEENGGGEVNCFDTNDAWAVEVQLVRDNTQYICLDTSGDIGVYVGNTIAGGDLVCGP